MAIQKELNIYFGTLLVMFSFAIVSGGLIFVFIRYQKKLFQKQRELLRLDAQYKQDLLASSIESAEKERIRIAKDIHDELGSIFSTLSLSVNQLFVENEYREEQYQQAKKLVELGITSVRRISHAIIPFEIGILGLSQTLENHLDSIETASGMQIDFYFQPDITDLNDSTSLAIYRIIQELTSNTLKYASAKNLLTHLKLNIDSSPFISVIYQDDGIGFAMESNMVKKGVGLKNIESRAVSLGGNAFFKTKTGSGFSCQVQIPYTKIKDHD